ncbi:immune-related, lectin-like receptor 4 isoform X1 [Epinephelus fuscoguttatus]|uniref:immune-related, lectin-like receptor 4 isoform X1 n=1 Tax=Epinephelus fuscoguttatus TaxID=293821 RepID=UPI0020D1636D|nr:immune-related, lectin-like receptor 4 isoform X1 [Epinephelus fuscoguttatus]
MPEVDVLYSDVKFTRERRNAHETSSSPADTTYSEVRIVQTQPPTELPGSQQLESNGRSKVTSERVALVILSALLMAAAIALGLTSYKNIETMERLQRLTHEHDTVKKNLTEKCCGVKSCNKVQHMSPQPPGEKNTSNKDDSCPKCEEGWEQHGGQCYYFSTDKSTWEESKIKCRQHPGGDLVKIDSRPEQAFLEVKLRKKMNVPEDKFWIGLTDSKLEGTWMWADSSPLNTSLTFWSGKEPDNWTEEDPAGEDCVRMGEKAGAEDLRIWFDKACKKPQKRICEKPADSGHLKCV